MKKIRNKKLLIGSIFACSAVALAGVGFASWVITGGSTTATVESLTVECQDVADHRVTLSASVYAPSETSGTTYGTVSFGPTYTSGNVITPSSTTSEEDLEFGLSVTLSCPASGVIKAGDKVVATFTPSQTESSKATLASYINQSSSNQYLNFGTTSDSAYTFTYTLQSNDIPSSADSSSLFTTTLKAKSTSSSSTGATESISYDSNLAYWSINFGWGAAFSYTNPADYYGSGSDTTKSLDTVITALKTLKEACENTTWTCSVAYVQSSSSSN